MASAMMVMLAGTTGCVGMLAKLAWSTKGDSVGGGCNDLGDLREGQVHCFGIAGRPSDGAAASLGVCTGIQANASRRILAA